MSKHAPQDSSSAEIIALKALAFLASDDKRLQRFVDLTGLTLAEIRQRAAEPRFLAAVMNHLRTDQSLLLHFATAEDLDPAAVDRAGRILAQEPQG